MMYLLYDDINICIYLSTTLYSTLTLLCSVVRYCTVPVCLRPLAVLVQAVYERQHEAYSVLVSRPRALLQREIDRERGGDRDGEINREIIYAYILLGRYG